MLTINIYRLTSIVVQLFDEINLNCINYRIESDDKHSNNR